MSALPRVAESTREQITREFDDVGPDACVAEISAHLREHNPEWLYMAAKCAGDVGDPQRIMGGFCMFYRLLIAQAAPGHPMTMESGAPAALNPWRGSRSRRAPSPSSRDSRNASAPRPV